MATPNSAQTQQAPANSPKADEVDNYINQIKDFEEYNENKDFIREHFGNIHGEKQQEYKDLGKQIYLLVEDDRIEFCAIKNNFQYFGKGWKLLDNEK